MCRPDSLTVTNLRLDRMVSGVLASMKETNTDYWNGIRSNQLRIAHYPHKKLADVPGGMFTPAPAAEIRANGAPATDTICINTLSKLRGYEKSPFMASFHPVRLMNRIYVANFNS